MHAEERAHIAHLLQIHHAHLRTLEVQAATYGELAVPTYIVLQMVQQRETIAELEGRMHAALPRHNLPPRDYEQFVGRHQELADVRKLLLPYPKSRAYVITIDGIGGIGKSALALETAYAFRDQYASLPEDERFEAIVWVSAKRNYLTADGILEHGQTFRTIDDLYTAIAHVLDYPAITRAKVEEQRAIVEEVLREQRTLLILDNLETVDDEELLSFLHELPDPAKAIVTTRHRIDVARPVRLTGMSHADALTLIAQEVARKGVTLSSVEHEQLWQRTGGVPLAIVWSIGLMGLGGSVESVLRRLGNGQSDIARFCFEESVAQIRGRDAHMLLLALSLFAVDASREAVGIVAGLGEDEFGRDVGLEELLRLSLVNKEQNRYSFLPLTRSFVLLEATSHERWLKEAQARMYAYFDNLTEVKGGWSKDWKGHELIERELPNLIALINDLLASLRYEHLKDGSIQLTSESTTRARFLQQMLPRIARTCRIRGDWITSEFFTSTVIRLYRELGDTKLIGHRYWDLSKIKLLYGDMDAAESLLRQAIEVWLPLNFDTMICRAVSTQGFIALHLGDVERGSDLIPQALHEYQQLGGDYALSDLLGNAGYLAEVQGDLHGAVAFYTQATTHARDNNDLPRLAADTVSLGRVHFALDNIDEARIQFRDALHIARECGRVDIIAEALYQLSLLEAPSASLIALDMATQALDLFRRLGMKHEQVEAEALITQLVNLSRNG